MINGYLEAEKISQQLDVLFKENNESNSLKLMELLKMSRTVRTTCELIEEVVSGRLLEHGIILGDKT